VVTVHAPVADHERLLPYVPRLTVDWLRHTPDDLVKEVVGTLAFVDISGFTRLTERLARHGNVGAEEMSDLLNATFASLLEVAYEDGAGLVKWGGDAVLLLFVGDGHAVRATRAAHRMRARMREVGDLSTTAGRLTLRMSVGIHSGVFHFFLVGDPTIHRELLVSGPAATCTAEVEGLAKAGEIAVSAQTAALLDPSAVGGARQGAFLLRAAPLGGEEPIRSRASALGLDIAGTIPPPIRAQLLASPGEAEHRQIAVGFVQFSGTDAVLEQQGPDMLAAALDEVIRNVQDAAAHHDVTFFETDIDRDGGKIMLTAGAPRSSDHNEERLLRAARMVLDRIGVLSLRIGLNCGPVFAGDFGPQFRRTFSVKGDAVNLAARVMAKARPGQLLATSAVVERSRTIFETDLLPPFLVKGKAHPVQALSIGPQQGERSDPTGRVPLVGREAEMTMLRNALAAAVEGRGQVVQIVGEPGIGKSRLVAELREGAGAIRTLLATCDEYETSTAYFPFRSLLLGVLGLPAQSPEQTVLDALRTRAEQDAPELVAWLPLVATALDVEMAATTQTASLDARFQKGKREEVVVEFLAAALRTPTLFVFDDTHLMDDASADLVARLAADLQDRPWLVLLTRRDTGGGLRPEMLGTITSVRPGALAAADALALVADSTVADPLPPHEMTALVQRAGGNPLFLRGLVLAARSGSPLDALPDTVEDLITSQIDRLPPQERTVLRYASVLGVTFHEDRLRALLTEQLRPTGENALTRLSYFVHPDGPGRFQFAHALIRDAAYQGLPYQRRRQLHGQVGEAIEAEAADPDDVSELLSLHFFHSATPQKAWHYSRVAADRARAKYVYVEATVLYARAVAAARALPEVTDREVAEVLQGLGESYVRVGDFRKAWTAFRDARVRISDDVVWSADLWRRQAEAEHGLGRLPQSFRTARRGLRLLQGTEGPQALAVRSRLERAAAVARETQGRHRDAIAWARLAESDATAADDKAALAEALQVLHGSYSLLRQPQDRPYGQLALALYEELGDRAGQSRALNNLAVLAWIEGRGVESLEMLSRAEEVAVVAGDTLGAALTRYNIADGLLRQGRVDAAETALRELLPVLRGLGAAEFAASTLRVLGLALSVSGRGEEGQELLTAARATMEEMGLASEVVETDGAIAEALLHSGDAAAAARLADRAVRAAQSLDAGYLLPTLQRIHGGALRECGDLTVAGAVLGQALANCQADGGVELGFVLAELAAVAVAAGDWPGAADLTAQSKQALTALGFVGNDRYPEPV
jgi:class 3 adenylate cyclase/tetratricopeptide (TPR) repeat protein